MKRAQRNIYIKNIATFALSLALLCDIKFISILTAEKAEITEKMENYKTYPL